MAEILKAAAASNERKRADEAVRRTVAELIEMVERRGDAAVRELSVRFDGFDRGDFWLSESEECLASVSAEDLEDIRFAAGPWIAHHQRATLLDLEVETLPGVVLGHKNVPVGSAGCYVPGGKYPLLASAHMSIITARVAGVERVITAAARATCRGCGGRPLFSFCLLPCSTPMDLAPALGTYSWDSLSSP